MRNYFSFLIFIFIFSCSSTQGVYWCGDHPCINKKEKEAYFKKTMIVEVRNYDMKKVKKDSEIEKLMSQAKLNQKKKILTDKEISKNKKLMEKEFAKKLKLDEKLRIKEEKELAKKIKLDEKRRIKEEKELAKKIKLDEKRRIKEEKELAKKLKLKKNEKNSNSSLQKNTTSNIKELNKKEVIIVESSKKKAQISSKKFNEIVEKIITKNNSKPYPDINDIPDL